MQQPLCQGAGAMLLSSPACRPAMMVLRTGEGGEVVNGRLKPANVGPSSDLAGASPDQGSAADADDATGPGSSKRSAFSFGAKKHEAGSSSSSSRGAAETIKAVKVPPKVCTCCMHLYHPQQAPPCCTLLYMYASPTCQHACSVCCPYLIWVRLAPAAMSCCCCCTAEPQQPWIRAPVW
jgi:hypothetical protein